MKDRPVSSITPRLGSPTNKIRKEEKTPGKLATVLVEGLVILARTVIS